MSLRLDILNLLAKRLEEIHLDDDASILGLHIAVDFPKRQLRKVRIMPEHEYLAPLSMPEAAVPRSLARHKS